PDDALAPLGSVLVGGYEEEREPVEAGALALLAVGLLRPCDDEVVLAVTGSDEDLLPAHVPLPVFVLLRGRAEPRHVGAGVRLGDVHRAPCFAARDLFDLGAKAGGVDPGA